jgi:hypothetical protein
LGPIAQLPGRRLGQLRAENGWLGDVRCCGHFFGCRVLCAMSLDWIRVFADDYRCQHLTRPRPHTRRFFLELAVCCESTGAPVGCEAPGQDASPGPSLSSCRATGPFSPAQDRRWPPHPSRAPPAVRTSCWNVATPRGSAAISAESPLSSRRLRNDTHDAPLPRHHGLGLREGASRPAYATAESWGRQSVKTIAEAIARSSLYLSDPTPRPTVIARTARCRRAPGARSVRPIDPSRQHTRNGARVRAKHDLPTERAPPRTHRLAEGARRSRMTA